MDLQSLFNIVIGLAGGLGGILLKLIWDAIREVKDADLRMTAELAELKVLVAGQYVTRGEYRDDMGGIKEALKRIEDKLDGKQDK